MRCKPYCTIASAVACTTTLFGLVAAPAHAQPINTRFDIPAQPLASSLRDVGSQANINVLVDPPLVNERQAPALRAEVTTDEALTRLLAGTGITHEFLNEKTVVVATADSSNAIRLAQAETSSNASTASSDSEFRKLTLEEIIVTAQRREEKLADVPISMTVLNGVALDQTRAAGASEILSRVPGIMVQPAQGGNTVLSIRGVSAPTVIYHGTSTTAYYIDSVPFGFVKSGFVPDLSVYDLERIEVMRGPQGTLYGSAALNGVVRVLTRDAELDVFDLKGRASASHTEAGSGNYRGDVAVNVPLIEGKLAARVVAGYEDYSGWIDRPNKKNSNNATRENIRLKLNAQPSEDFSAGLSVWRSRDHHGDSDTGYAFDRDSFFYEQPTDGGFDAYGLEIGYRFPALLVSSATSYIDYSSEGTGDFGASEFNDPERMLLTRTLSEVLSQEITFSSTSEGQWLWSAGLFFRKAEDKLFQTLPAFLPNPVDFNDKSESSAVFGQLTRRFMDGRWELTGGLRYFRDHVEQIEASRFDSSRTGPLVHDHSRFTSWSPRAVITWHPSEAQAVYASFGRGFRSGYGQNILALYVNPDLSPVEPDTLSSYELGSKGSFLNGRVNFDVAAYYMKWKDLHQAVTMFLGTTPIAAVANGESASGFGIDGSMGLRPAAGLELAVNFSWNDLKSDARKTDSGLVVLDKGDPIGNSKLTIGGSVDYSFALGSAGFEGTISTSANWTSKTYGRVPSPTGTRLIPGDNLLFVRAGLTIDAPSNWAATLFVENLNNEDASLGGTPLRGVPDPSGFRLNDRSLRPRPRTVGLQVEYSFK